MAFITKVFFTLVNTNVYVKFLRHDLERARKDREETVQRRNEDNQTDGQTNRQSDRQSERLTDRQTDRKTV